MTVVVVAAEAGVATSKAVVLDLDRVMVALASMAVAR